MGQETNIQFLRYVILQPSIASPNLMVVIYVVWCGKSIFEGPFAEIWSSFFYEQFNGL